MASNRIKGITIEIGGDTTQLDKALKSTDSNLYKIQKDLRAVEAALKMDPGNLDLLAQKQRLLAAAVSESSARLGILARAAEESNKALEAGQIDLAQYNNLNLEADLAAAAFKDAERALADFNSEMRVSGVNTSRAANGIDDVGNAARGSVGDITAAKRAAENASGSMGDLGGAAQNSGGEISFVGKVSEGAAHSIGKKLVDAAIEAVKWMWSLDEATEEYREAMGKLNTAVEHAGFDAETAKTAYTEFYKILGETDTATEASQLLGNMVNREEELNQLTGLLRDQYDALSASIPIDELIKAANETARTGEVTDSLAKAIEWAGGNASILKEKLDIDPEKAVGLDRLKIVTDELSRALFDTSYSAQEASDLFYELASSTDNLSKWTDIAAGVYATFGDSLPIEGLIEAANETAKTGKVTGVLADALNWAGVNEDDFNERLEDIGDSGNRVNFIMGQLIRTYGESADAFYENNEALIASREEQAKLEESMAVVGDAVMNLKTQFMQAFGEPLAIILNAAATGIEKIGDLLDWVGERIQDVANFFRELFDVSGRWEGGKLVYDTSPGGSKANARMSVMTDVPYSLQAATAENLPHLARGTVARPNNPFLAVIGDNPQEQEIVSPYSTIKQAVMDAQAEGGSMSPPIQVNINYTGSLAQLVRLLQPHITAEVRRLGQSYAT